MRSRILLFLTGLILVPVCTYFVILFARGYRPDFTRRSLQPTGLLVLKSLPDGAQIYINSKLTSATDTTINLTPGTYKVEIKKQGFSVWAKTLQVDAEVVTRTVATLFPSVPSFKAITTTGATNPIFSPDGTKVVFTNLPAGRQATKAYLLDLNESPLGLINRDVKEIASTASAWKTPTKIDPLPTLPQTMQDILATAAASLVWAPKENKVMYTATASAIIPDELIRPLPGSSTQTQSRTIIPNGNYVYDLEEDRNFAIPAGVTWFPDSYHLLKAEKGKVTVLEYDGTNSTVVYSGPMEDAFAFPYPSGKQLLILANLSANSKTSVPNLYAVSLR